MSTTESPSRDAHPILFRPQQPLALNLTVQGAGVRMQQMLSTAIEHCLSEIFALHFRLYPLHTLDNLSKLCRFKSLQTMIFDFRALSSQKDD